MRNHKGDIRGFIHSGSAWYASSMPGPEKDSISIGMYAPDGGTSGEFMIDWVELNGKFVPQLAAFDDAWSALENFTDMLKEMAKLDSKGVTPQKFCEMLKSIGIEDLTERVRPREVNLHIPR